MRNTIPRPSRLWAVALWPAAAAALASLPALAQGGGGAAADAIEEVIVTARRREENAQSVPIPVTAMSHQDLRDRAAHDMRDLNRITPNMDFQQSAPNKSAARVFLRGIGQSNWAATQDPKIGIYVDGVYFGRSQGGVFDFLDVQRVEVLRGPQGTLFGRNTTAGLIHVVSNRPQEEFDYAFGGGAGSDGIRSASGMVNLPLGDALAARFAASHRGSDGYVRNTGTGENWNDENSQMARLSLRWRPNERIVGDLIAEYQRARELGALGNCEWGGPDNGADAPIGLPSAAFWLGIYDRIKDACNATMPYASSENDSPRSDVDALTVSATVSADLGFATLSSISSWRDIADFNASWGMASDTVGSPSYLEVHGSGDNTGTQWTQELRLSGTGASGDLEWTAGVYLFDEDASNPTSVPVFRGVRPPDCRVWPIACLPSPIPGLTLGAFAIQAFQIGSSRDQLVEASNASRALFGEVVWRFAERFALTAGIRQTWDKRRFRRTQTLLVGTPDPSLRCPPGTPPPVGGATCSVGRDFDAITPRAILSYDLSGNIMLYGGWSRGYSSGGFNQDVRMRPYDPEISGNWEGGIKSLLFGGRLMLNATAFRNSYENQQITVGRIVNGQPTADLINARRATLYGIESELRAELPAGFYLLGSIGALDGAYDEFTVQDNLINPATGAEIVVARDLSDSELVRMAPLTYSFALGRHAALAGGATLNAQLGWAFRARTFNTLDSRRSSRQGKYGLLDARIVYSLPNGRTAVSLWGSNLLNREYFPSALDLSENSGTITKYWGEPRRIGLEIDYRPEG